MENSRCKLYRLVLSLAGCDKDIPEAVLYGCIILNSNIKVKTMEFLCADFGLRSLSQIAMGYENIKNMIETQNLSENNIKAGVPLLLPVLKEIYVPLDLYIAKVSRYKEDITLDQLFKDAMEAMSDENLRLFTNISCMKRIERFRNDLILTNGLQEKFSTDDSGFGHMSVTADLAMQMLASFGLTGGESTETIKEAVESKFKFDTEDNGTD